MKIRRFRIQIWYDRCNTRGFYIESRFEFLARRKLKEIESVGFYNGLGMYINPNRITKTELEEIGV